MNGLPYYKAYPRDFFEGTIGMDFEVKAAYRLLLDLIYMHGGRMADDPRFIAGHLGCSVKRWNVLRRAILGTGKVTVSDGYLGNYRADKELDSLKSFQDKQREKAAKPRKNKGLALAAAEPKPSHTEPDTDKKEREAKASPKKDDDFDEFWAVVPKKVAKAAAVKAYRSARKIADAKTILDGMRRYAASRAGEDPKFTAHPATWLNAGRWADVASPPKAINLRDPQIGDQFTAKDGRLMEWCGIDGWLEVRS